MQFSGFLAFVLCVFSGPALAQLTLEPSLAVLPHCAVSCLNSSSVLSTCSAGNLACLCLSEPFQDALALCVGETCTVKESLTTKNASLAACGVNPRVDTHVFYDTTTTLEIIAGIVVIVRMLHRLFIIGSRPTPDDWAVALALLVGVPSAVINVYGTIAHGLGRDIWTVPFDDIYDFGFYFYIMGILYYLEMTLLKLSLLLFYMRIFPSQTTRRVLMGTMALVVAQGVIFIFVCIFECKPISYYWTRWDEEHQGVCLDGSAIVWSNAAIGIALDFWMLAIPLSQLRHLRLHWKKKVGVALMFCVGAFVTVVSILRLQSLIAFTSSSNPTWDDQSISKWSTVEVTVGIICACMPSLRLVLAHYFPRIVGSSAQSSYQHGNNAYANAIGKHSGFAARGGGGGGSTGNNNNTGRAPRSIPLVPSSGISRGDYSQFDDREGVSGTVISASRLPSGANHSLSRGNDPALRSHPNSAPKTVILYAKSYAVERTSDHDETQLVHERTFYDDGQGRSDRSNRKSDDGDTSSGF